MTLNALNNGGRPLVAYTVLSRNPMVLINNILKP